MNPKSVIIVGAGPAGLTAAWELVQAGWRVTVLESDADYVGGLSRTICYKGVRFDIGGHRFFSKNQEITRWWRERLPGDFIRVKRLSRILYRGQLFQYPLRAKEVICRLGWKESLACCLSYLVRQLAPIRPERSFEDWVRNRFGDNLYQIFFKTYTEKVWGMPCSAISADWASQRIKGLSLWKAALDALGFRQGTLKTLADEFEYPRLGAGMMWEVTRDQIIEQGGQIYMGRKVMRFEQEGDHITSIHSVMPSGENEQWSADAFIISMPLRDCVLSMGSSVEASVREAATKLTYRDFMLVALIVNRIDLFPDNWIYVHDPTVKVGRIQNYNNWSKAMAPDQTTLELEYFCSKDDALWSMDDNDIMELAKREVEQLGLAKAAEIVDGCVVRVEKAYPVYDAHFNEHVSVIREALVRIENLQMIGRNGLHKYNNQDHSMLTGILAARNLIDGRNDLWKINTDAEYQEEEDGVRQVPRAKVQ